MRPVAIAGAISIARRVAFMVSSLRRVWERPSAELSIGRRRVLLQCKRVEMAEKIIIIGAGIGGLTAALGLLQRGFDVEVYEQAPELKEIGAGVQISSNGTRVLHALGLGEALARVQVIAAG